MTSDDLLDRIWDDRRQPPLPTQPPAPAAEDAFLALLERLHALYRAKNADYGAGDDPLGNLRRCEQLGIPAWKGVLVRLSDKWQRVIQLSQHDAQVKTESLVDTALDLAAYSLLFIVLLEEPHAP